jgi:hypothetical protein
LEVFSLISVDHDRQDVDRALRTAISSDEFFGRVFRPSPGRDFEFENFEREELAEVLWRIAAKQGAGEEIRPRLLEAAREASNAGDLLKRANRAVPEYRFAKGEVWGRELADHFLEHMSKPDGSDRTIREALDYAYAIQRNQYGWTRREYRVDPETGAMVRRRPNSGSSD